MVDQTTVEQHHANGAETPPQAVARSSMEFLHDLITLGELQAKLLLLDAQEGLTRLAIWAGVLAVGALLALACFPVCLAVIALWIAELGGLSTAQAFTISLLLGLIVAAAMIGAGIYTIRSRATFLQRSWTEWRQNVRWVKETLRRLSSSGPRNRFPGAPR